jgi:hypothetical protein
VIFRSHSALSGQHAFLSPSNYHWINYDDQKLEARFTAAQAAKRGTDLHELAHMAIKLGVKMPKAQLALNRYVNDGISYKMAVEQPLYYSDNCFGTADTISFRKGNLRIHDLKTGITRASVHQLEVYAAIFCLEYGVDPYDINIEMRIYQGTGYQPYEGVPQVIERIMEKIMRFDAYIEQMKGEL